MLRTLELLILADLATLEGTARLHAIFGDRRIGVPISRNALGFASLTAALREARPSVWPSTTRSHNGSQLTRYQPLRLSAAPSAAAVTGPMTSCFPCFPPVVTLGCTTP